MSVTAADPPIQTHYSAREPTLSVREVVKHFSGVTALRGVSVDFYPGQAHALVGENGAGKSTLIKVMTGVYTQDSGDVSYLGSPAAFGSPRAAQEAGVQTIYQEVHLAPRLSVARNLFIGREPHRLGLLDLRTMHRTAESVLAKYNLHCDVSRPLAELGLGMQQMIAIVRAVTAAARVVIMDEPTSSLEPREVDKLLDVVTTLKNDGVAVVYVSHKLEEVFRVCDTVTVLRDGALVHTGPTSEITRLQLIGRMLGRDVSDLNRDGLTAFGSGIKVAREGAPVLEATGLTRRGELDDVSVTVHAGEVVGLAGLLGSGRSETLKAIFGADPLDSGEVRINGKLLSHQRPAERINAGIALLPEDRKAEGIIPELSIRDNIVLAVLSRVSNRGFTSRKAQDELVGTFMKRLRIKASGPEQLVQELSGGNQQKVLLARLMCLHPKVLLLDEPTRGIDVGAKSEVQLLIAELAEQGVSVVLVSSELDELVEGAESLVVLRDRKPIGVLHGDDVGADAVMDLIAAAADDDIAETKAAETQASETKGSETQAVKP